MSMHAILSASSSHRWLKCPPSALLCHDKKESISEYALEGTDAHALAEYKLRKILGEKVQSPIENLTYFNKEMDECAESYASFIVETLEEIKKRCQDPKVLIEQRLDYSTFVPDGFGTGDCVIVADDTLSIIDFKYGMGVLVEAENNTQLMCYALGVILLFDGIYNIKTVEMTIYQPRRENISTWSISKEKLLHWADTILKPIAEIAIKGEGEFKAGQHCKFCKVKATCRKRAEYNLAT